MTYTYQHTTPFVLENGQSLQGLSLTYTVLGDRNATNKVVWIFHALTANSNPLQWWEGLVGKDKLFDPEYYTIICVNLPGSCYGSSGPLSINPQTGQPYHHDFPVFSTQDTVRTFQLIQAHLSIPKIHIGIGASMGGQHLLQWAAEQPDNFESIIPIACNAAQSPWSLAIDTAQQMAIEADNTWKEKTDLAGINGMKAARAIALVHYRTYQSFAEKTKDADHNAASYQRYQAEKLAERFNAFSYYNLSQSRATYNLAKYFNSTEQALERIKATTLLIGISSDGLFPIFEQRFLANHIPNAKLAVLDSIYGHDAFLVEYAQLTQIIEDFLKKNHLLPLKKGVQYV